MANNNETIKTIESSLLIDENVIPDKTDLKHVICEDEKKIEKINLNMEIPKNIIPILDRIKKEYFFDNYSELFRYAYRKCFLNKLEKSAEFLLKLKIERGNLTIKNLGGIINSDDLTH